MGRDIFLSINLTLLAQSETENSCRQRFGNRRQWLVSRKGSKTAMARFFLTRRQKTQRHEGTKSRSKKVFFKENSINGKNFQPFKLIEPLKLLKLQKLHKPH
jgi:hypothetical protein